MNKITTKIGYLNIKMDWAGCEPRLLSPKDYEKNTKNCVFLMLLPREIPPAVDFTQAGGIF
jgi:hypothetical protein